jgi:chemotaxis protein MotB
MLKIYIILVLFLVTNLSPDTKETEEESLDFFYFRSEYRELLNQKKIVDKNLEDLQSKFQKLEAENSELSEKVVAFEEEVVTLHKDTLNYKREVEGRISHLYSVIEVLTKEKAKLENQLTELQKKQNEILASQNRLQIPQVKTEAENSVIEKYRNLQNELAVSKKENEALSKRFSETLEKQKRTEAQLKETESKLEQVTKKLDQSEREKQLTAVEMTKRVEKAEKEKNQSLSEISKKLEQTEKEKQLTIADYTKKLEQTEKEKQAGLIEVSKKLESVQKEKELTVAEMNQKLENSEKEKIANFMEVGDATELQEEKEKLAKQNTELLNSLNELKHLVQGVEEHEARLLAENEKLKKEIERLTHRQKKEIEKNLEAEIQKGDVKVEERGKRLVINVFDQITFDPGSSKLKKSGKRTLLKLVKTIRNYNGQRLYIEGNTDNTPIRFSKYLDNWELSTARSVSVVRFLIKKGIYPKYITAAGNSYYNPLKPNTSDANRALNRRVDIVLAPFE